MQHPDIYATPAAELSRDRIPRNMWVFFEHKEDQQDYMRFLEKCTAMAVLIGGTIIGGGSLFAVAVLTHLRSEALSAKIVALLRLIVVGLSWIYIYIEYHRRQQTIPSHTNAFLPSFNLPALADQILIWNAVFCGITLIQQTIAGKCSDNELWCNANYESNGLPTGAVLSTFLTVIYAPVIFKAHSLICVMISVLIAVSSVIASAFISHAIKELIPILVVSLILIFVLYDFESNMFNLYISQRNSRYLHEEALEAVKMKKESEIESNSMCAIIGNVAHDLKTPLQSFMSELVNLEALIGSYCVALTGPEAGDMRRRDIHAEIKQTLSSLQNIYAFMMLAINRGIDFRKAVAGLSLQARRETFKLADEVEWAMSRFDSNTIGAGLRVVPPSNDKNSLCPLIISDKHWFSENILSLVSNALKFTLAGYVEVEYHLAALSNAGKLREPSVVIYDATVADIFSLVQSNTDSEREHLLYVLVIVQDEGVGIPVEMRSTLFQPFKQAQRRAGGTGLGLFSISKRMEALGGHCGVQGRSDGKQGSCFWLAYPYVPDWESAREETARAAYGSNSFQQNGFTGNKDVRLETSRSDRLADNLLSALSSMPQSRLKHFAMPLDDPFWRQVLLVEDSSLIVKALTRLLKREGFQVDTAQNGAVGLEKMKEKPYVFVLSDIQMPIMDGNEMVKRFRDFEISSLLTNGTRRERQVIFGMSANSDVDTENEALGSGMNQFIAKPVSCSSIKLCLFLEYYSAEIERDDARSSLT